MRSQETGHEAFKGNAVAITANRQRRKGRIEPLVGQEESCSHQSERLSEPIEALKELLLEHGPAFFTCGDVRAQVREILKGYRPRGVADRQFLEGLQALGLATRRGKDCVSQVLQLALESLHPSDRCVEEVDHPP